MLVVILKVIDVIGTDLDIEELEINRPWQKRKFIFQK